MASPFDVLAIDPDASEGEIVDAYRRRVKETHPDRGGSVAEFKAVQEAYEQLQSGEPMAEIEVGEAATAASDGTASPDAANDGTAEAEPSPGPVGARVTYLNYEVLDDHGWALDDPDLFEKAEAADLDADDYGTLLVSPDESILEAAEDAGLSWPYACRGGACANCAVAVTEGEVDMPSNHVLPPRMLSDGVRLSCIAAPATDGMEVVFNVKHVPDLDGLRLPPQRFERSL